MKLTVAVPSLVSTLFLFVFWHLAAVLAASPLIVPYPGHVFLDLLDLARGSDFLSMLLATVIRGFSAFFLAVVFAFLIGIPAGLSRCFEAALRPWMAVIRSTPVVSLILLAIFWFGSSIVPIFVSILMTMPVMTESIRGGIRNTNPELLAMSRVYGFTPFQRLRHIRIPSLLPYFINGAGSSLGLTWKVVIAGEILAFPKTGIGTAMQTAKIHLETGRVFSLTVLAVLLCLLTEKIFATITRRISFRLSGGVLA